MYEIICSEMTTYSNLEPLMIDFMDIMNNYNKAIIIFEYFTGYYYVNDVAQKIFSYPMNENNIESFIDAVDFSEASVLKQSKKIDFELLNIKVGVSFKQIIGQDTIKYIMCTLEDVVYIHDVEKEQSLDEMILKDIIGESSVISSLKHKIKKVSITDSTVLLMGETGTGKELFAKTIHRISNRKNNPFVAINCGAIPDTLIESELFGYEKGAFTGADLKGKVGKFEQANGGTIFLDEIENMSNLLQMKLLRVLEDRKIIRVGGMKEIPIDIRIIAATNYNLYEMVKKNEFRKDLYYRLNIVKLNIPDLKERHEDILLLSRHFIRIFSNKMKKKVFDLSEEVKAIFLGYSWEGNVRELRNSIEYAMNFEDSNYISKINLPEQFTSDVIEVNTEPVFKTIADLEREQIERALNHFGWDDKGRQRAAEVLGISRSSIYRKISK